MTLRRPRRADVRQNCIFKAGECKRWRFIDCVAGGS